MSRKTISYFLRLLFLLSVLLVPVTGQADFHGRTILDGVYVNGISLGGMTSVEAVEALDEHFQAIADSEFTITCMDGQEEHVRAGDWGMTWDSLAAVRQALEAGKSGGLLQLYKDQTDLKKGMLYLEVP